MSSRRIKPSSKKHRGLPRLTTARKPQIHIGPFDADLFEVNARGAVVFESAELITEIESCGLTIERIDGNDADVLLSLLGLRRRHDSKNSADGLTSLQDIAQQTREPLGKTLAALGQKGLLGMVVANQSKLIVQPLLEDAAAAARKGMR